MTSAIGINSHTSFNNILYVWIRLLYMKVKMTFKGPSTFLVKLCLNAIWKILTVKNKMAFRGKGSVSHSQNLGYAITYGNGDIDAKIAKFAVPYDGIYAEKQETRLG